MTHRLICCRYGCMKLFVFIIVCTFYCKMLRVKSVLFRYSREVMSSLMVSVGTEGLWVGQQMDVGVIWCNFKTEAFTAQ